MTEKAVPPKAEALPDLDDLLQCPVCYEIPTGQIFQCNEGHHVCGRCKVRLDVCPVCRAFFFGTRNYAMEELIANIRKLRAFKLGGKVTTGNTTPEQQSEAKESTSEENESTNEEDEALRDSVNTLVEPPRPCSGLFRCLCCKINPERLPSGRLLNHLRYYHSPDLIEGRSDENGEYLQAWEFATDVGRIVTAVRVADMGLFFLVIEIALDSICTWLVMAASPRVAEDFSYTYTLSGNDREAIFSDCAWSVRTCEGFLKKRQRCLLVSGSDARALLAPATMSAKLRVRRTPLDAGQHVQPRAVLRVANRSQHSDAPRDRDSVSVSEELEPFLQDLQNDVARLSRAFATLGREANALVEADMRARLDVTRRPTPPAAAPLPPMPAPMIALGMTRNARRRMRQRLRQALRENIENAASAPQAEGNARRNTSLNPLLNDNNRILDEILSNIDASQAARSNMNSNAANTPRSNNDRANNNQHRENTRAGSPGRAVPSAVAAEEPGPAPADGRAAPAADGAAPRANKKKRRQRR